MGKGDGRKPCKKPQHLSLSSAGTLQGQVSLTPNTERTLKSQETRPDFLNPASSSGVLWSKWEVTKASGHKSFLLRPTPGAKSQPFSSVPPPHPKLVSKPSQVVELLEKIKPNAKLFLNGHNLQSSQGCKEASCSELTRSPGISSALSRHLLSALAPKT